MMEGKEIYFCSMPRHAGHIAYHGLVLGTLDHPLIILMWGSLTTSLLLHG